MPKLAPPDKPAELNLCLQWWGIPGGEMKEKLDFLEANGFGAVEIPSGDWPIKNADAMIEAMKGRKLFLATACGPSDFSYAEPEKREGQDEGSAMMGFGHSFYESIHFDGGQIINSTLVDYKVPTFDDVPETFESILIEAGNGPGPYGSKGLGEGGIIPVAPAVANAIAWSTGARIKELPLTPEKVWRAMRAAASSSFKP